MISRFRDLLYSPWPTLGGAEEDRDVENNALLFWIAISRGSRVETLVEGSIVKEAFLLA